MVTFNLRKQIDAEWKNKLKTTGTAIWRNNMGALQPEDKYNCFQGEETVF